MICLADNDILLKLSCCDLLIPLFDTLDIPYANIQYLSSLPYMLKKRNMRDKYNVGVDRLRVFLNRISRLTFPSQTPRCLVAYREEPSFRRNPFRRFHE